MEFCVTYLSLCSKPSKTQWPPAATVTGHFSRSCASAGWGAAVRLSQSLRGLSRDGVQGGLAPARVLSPPPAPYGMVAGFPSERSREESPRGLSVSLRSPRARSRPAHPDAPRGQDRRLWEGPVQGPGARKRGGSDCPPPLAYRSRS